MNDMTKPESMSEEEWADINVAKDTVRNEKLRVWEYMDSLLRMPQEELRHSGYKTHEEAIHKTMVRSQQTVKKVWDAHLRKYPDD